MTDTINPEGTAVSIGVQELIEKLRRQGVQSGRTEAEKIVSDAQNRADRLISESQKKADNIIKKAREDAEFITKSGEEALQLAERNAILELKEYLLKQFSSRVSAVVSSSMKTETLLKQMIIEVAGNNHLRGEKNIEVILPRKVIGANELRDDPELVKNGPLLEFVMSETSSILQDGVTFTVGDDNNQTGIGFKLKEKSIVVELTDEAVSTMLLKHLQPRFRALLEGIIK